MEPIRSLIVDIDKGILNINGQDVKEPVIVTLPGPYGWPVQKLFDSESNMLERSKQIKIIIDDSKNEKTIKRDEISKIFSQRMRGINAHPDDLPVITAVIETMKNCTIEQAEAILDDTLKIIKTMTKIR